MTAPNLQGAARRPPPRLLVATSVVVLAVSTVLAVLGAFRTGITTDEPIHVMRLQNFFETGWYALDWDYAGAGPGSDGTNTSVYGPVAMLLLHAWSVLWGVEGWGEVAASPHAYDVRHLGVVVLGLVGLAAVAATGRVLLRHWRWGLVAAAALAAIPMWTGHEMFNVKDVPVATGYTLVTLGLMLFVRQDPPDAGRRTGLRLARAGCLAAGVVLTLGTRPGMWPGLLASVLVALVLVPLVARSRVPVGTVLQLAASCAVSVVVLVAVYPRLFGSPLLALSGSSETSSRFLAGEKSDRFYVPRHLGQEMPALLLGFALVGTAVALAVLWRRRRDLTPYDVRVALVGVQAFALPVVAIALGSDLYHGLRQLLFAIPALAVLSAYGVAWSLERPAGFARRLVPVAAAAALLLPTVDQVTLQPYQTTYVNFATDVTTEVLSGDGLSASERPGGDFWRVSLPELIEDATLDRQLVCKAATGDVSGTAFPFTNSGVAFSTSRSLDCREEPNGPLAPFGLPVVRQLPATEFDAVFIEPLPANCSPLGEVTRWRHGFEIVLSTLGRCTIDPATLDETGVKVTDPALGTTLAGDLWLFAVDGWQQWPGEDELTSPVALAELAFRPSPGCAEHRCALVVTGTAPADLVATVAGAEVQVRRGADGTIRVPVAPQQDLDGVWVTLTRRSGETLGMRLTGLRLEASPAGRETEGPA